MTRFYDRYDIERMAQDMYAKGIHLADSRDDWLKLMMWMAGGGERLLDSFLMLSSMAGKKYKERENRKAFMNAVKKSSDASLSGFIKICELYGLSRDEYRRETYVPYSKYSNRGIAASNPSIPSNISNHNSNNSTTMGYFDNDAKPIQVMDRKYLKQCRSNSSYFFQAVVATGLLSREQAASAAEMYHLGAKRDGSVIFWQIDKYGCPRDGKTMLYDNTCHRKKTPGSVNWMSNIMRRQRILTSDWEASHCLFGLHLLDERPNDTICIVESEKTAFVCSQVMPDSIWMATGGMSALSPETLRVLEGRQIVLYPDTDTDGSTYEKWLDIAWKAKMKYQLDISVSNFLETEATPEQKEAKIDILDYLADELMAENGVSAPSEAEMPTTEPVADAAIITDPAHLLPCAEATEIPIPKTSAQSDLPPLAAKVRRVTDAMAAQLQPLPPPEQQLREMTKENPALGELFSHYDAKMVDSS